MVVQENELETSERQAGGPLHITLMLFPLPVQCFVDSRSYFKLLNSLGEGHFQNQLVNYVGHESEVTFRGPCVSISLACLLVCLLAICMCVTCF